MKTSQIKNRLHFQFLVMLPFAAVLLILAFFYGGCQKKEEPKKEVTPTITMDNLQTAYGKSVKRAQMYKLFVGQAQKEKNTNLSNLYKAISRSEEIHASVHAQLLKSHNVEPKVLAEEVVTVGTALQTLKMAQSSEELEYASMYPNLARTAEIEKFMEARDQFLMIKDADARHGDLIKEATEKNGKIAKTTYFVCTGCGYILTSGKADECPICHRAKDKFESI